MDPVQCCKVLLFKIPQVQVLQSQASHWLRQALAMLAYRQLFTAALFVGLRTPFTPHVSRGRYDYMRNGELSWCKFLSKNVINRYQMKQTRIGNKI